MTDHRDAQHDRGAGENGRAVGEATASGTVGADKAWARVTIVAGASVLLTMLVSTIFLGPPSAYGAGRVFGRFLPAYLITSVIAVVRPRHRSWGRIVILFLSIFIGLFLLPVLGSAVDPVPA